MSLVRRLIRKKDLSLGEATTPSLTIPIGGGTITTSLTLADFGLRKEIEMIVNVKVERLPPVVQDVYTPSYGINTTLDAVGITLSAGTGTSLMVMVVVLGY